MTRTVASRFPAKLLLVCGCGLVMTALGGCGDRTPGAVGTPELRAALFDTIVARTERREAFSPVKNAALGFDPIQSMLAVRDDFIAAETEEELFYALSRVSAARRDRHLSLALVPGGLEVPDSAGLEIAVADDLPTPQAPVRVLPDYSEDGASYFVADVAPVFDRIPLPQIGDRVVAVNGIPVADWEAEATRYMRHSTTVGLKWKLAEAMTTATALFPPEMRGDPITLTTRSKGGDQTPFALPVVNPDELEWTGQVESRYAGFESLHRTTTYELLVDYSRRILILVWTGFRETMVDDVDALIQVAEDRDLLDYTMVVDVTGSRGGSRGAYALQRLQRRPFKTTFGNLRLSDVIEPFVAERREAFGERDFTDSGVRETIDDGTWLMEWLEEDVMPALARGDAYTTNVPFKSAHAPKDSNGVLEPAPVHFRGPFAVISGPSGGSHLDQFVHQVVDNDLGPVVGLPPGGYSNTWEWEETLTYPGTDQPVVRFMWNIGHTITPNGEIAEGNPATIDEWIPVTPDNVDRYHEILLEAALRRLLVL